MTPLNGKPAIGMCEVTVRHGFIRKVFGILGTQLVFTTFVASLVYRNASYMVKTAPGLTTFLLFASLAVSVAIMCVFMCSPDTMRRSPQNYCLLAAFTVAESLMVGFICIQYTQESVLITLAITAITVLALTLFACQTSIDFTGLGPYLFCGMLVLMGLSFVVWIGSMCGLGGSPAFSAMRLLYAAGGALLFSCYIVYDTQLILGGSHKHQFCIDDYCMAAISLYIDIIQLFLFLLRMFGQRRS
jgi:hypothetical protein